MKIIEQWIVKGVMYPEYCSHLVKLEDGTFWVGVETNGFSYQQITEERALSLLSKHDKP